MSATRQDRTADAVVLRDGKRIVLDWEHPAARAGGGCALAAGGGYRMIAQCCSGRYRDQELSDRGFTPPDTEAAQGKECIWYQY
jgi:hypothetical protein